MVGKVDGIGAVGLYERTDVDRCGEHIIFGTYHILMIDDPVKIKAEVHGGFGF